MELAEKSFVPLTLRLRTDNSVLGRLRNIAFVSSGTIATVIKYYWHGPDEKSWCLRFHVLKNILHQYLTESLPHTTPNHVSAQIDFSYISDYIELNNLPSRALSPSVGWNSEFDIVVGEGACVEYSLEKYGLSGTKLNRLSSEDRVRAQQGRPRVISCQVVLGAQMTRCSKCLSNVNPSCSPELLMPQPLEPNERIIIHFHGGAYCVGERSLTHLYIYANISSCAGLRVFSPNYRMSPRHCFPSHLHDCFVSYMHIVGCGFKPENIILAGDSAGGALAVELLMILKEMAQPRPAGLVLISPWVDSTCAGKSWVTNQGLDYLPGLLLEDPFHPTRMFYAAGTPFSEGMLEELKCPLVSPIFGDLSDMPPMLIQLGEYELLSDDIHAFAAKAKQQNSTKPSAVKLEVYDKMPHVFVMFDFMNEAQQAFASFGRFARAIFEQQEQSSKSRAAE
ncbi:hypothetical protein GGF44_002255 [Coemansia sp. RSA 1694]|nr:hypothetical protein GGF44_002255 [Coemansia sp. RSA 1694]